MRKLFHGGVHPSGQKELILSRMPQAVQPPDRLIIPLRQHIGAPCKPLVKPGDEVLAGQKIGDGEGLCVPVHASVSGRVISIEDMPYPSLGRAPAVVIENDHRDARIPAAPHESGPNPSALMEIMREAGIVGMGGAGFPAHAKLASSLGRTDTLIVNACECEPYITADDALICTWPRQVLGGIGILQRALQPKRSVLAIEANKPEAIAALQAALADFSGVELAVLPARYPQGGEKQLVLAVTGREIRMGKLPADAGCAVFNASTAAAIFRAVREGMPLTQRIVSVSGEGVLQPQNFIVPIGTPFAHLISAAGGLARHSIRLISGGPMMGAAQASPDVPVIKTTNAILCLPAADRPAHPRCIRCGKCVDACPMHLQPLYLYHHAGNTRMQAKFNLFDCIECGCCSYICPGKLPLTEQFRASKRAIREENAK